MLDQNQTEAVQSWLKRYLKSALAVTAIVLILGMWAAWVFAIGMSLAWLGRTVWHVISN